MTILVTGAAGFIGHAVCKSLIARDEQIVAVDNLNAYYDPLLKLARLNDLGSHPNFHFADMDIADFPAVSDLAKTWKVRKIIHLAAQAGVRYSLDNPFAYQDANLKGHLSILETARHLEPFEHLIYASSSSVYGDRPRSESFSEDDFVDNPLSLYAATKRGDELLSISYSHLYGLRQTGLRFFTVYGPFGRPDMAYFHFTQKILAGQPIEVFGQGEMARDFTYIDDIISGILGVLDHPPLEREHRIFNIGSGRPIALLEMIALLEDALEKKAIKTFLPMQPGDVTVTFANIAKIRTLTGYSPKMSLSEGLLRFVRWYQGYYKP